VTGDDVVDGKAGGAAVERLSAEDAAESAVVLAADLADDSVHRPAVELAVREDREREPILDLIALDRLQALMNITYQ
jgi:hypothetical protein